jgi:hypothetical protein
MIRYFIKKVLNLKVLKLAFSLVIIFITVLSLFQKINIYAAIYTENSSASFNGTGASGLAWNTPNSGYGTDGTAPTTALTYTSNVIDSTSNSTTWDTFSYGENLIYNAELSANKLNETLTNPKGIDLSNTVALYRFSEVPPFSAYNVSTGTGTRWVDQSGNNNFGICGPICPDSTTDAVFTRALQNNGQGNKVLVLPTGVSVRNMSQFTFAFWVKTTSFPTSPAIRVLYEEAVPGGTNARFRILINSVGNLEMQVRNTDGATTATTLLTSTKNIIINNWYHMAFVFNADTDIHKFYLNGVPETNTVAMNAFPNTVNSTASQAPKIANAVGMASGTKYQGRFDEFGIYNREMTQTELEKMYVRGRWKVSYEARSCDDSACSGESFVGPTGLTTTPFSQLNNPVFPSPALYTLNQSFFIPNRYFQFRINFTHLPASPPFTGDPTIQAYVNFVTVNYTIGTSSIPDPPTLSFVINNNSDISVTNNCDLGEASLTSSVNCSYRLKVSTDNSTGYFIFVSTNSGLSSTNQTIDEANTAPLGGNVINNSTAGIEKYGANFTTGSITGTGSISLSTNYNSTNHVKLSTGGVSELLITSTGANEPATIDTTNTVLVNHNLNISSQTDAGLYNQSVTYTVTLRY